MGDGVFGIEAAARKHYGKNASGLTAMKRLNWPQLFLTRADIKTDGTSKYVENRSERIYQIMVRRGIVIPDYDDVVSQKMKIIPKRLEKKQSRARGTEHSPEPLTRK